MVVLVPGLGLDTRAWTAVRAQLIGPSMVVTLPSMGQPAPRGTDLRVERQSRRVIDELPEGREVILVGHSASCPVVVDVATRALGVVGLVLVGPVTDPRADTWPRMIGQWLRTATHEHVWEIPVLAPQYRSTGVSSMLRGMHQTRRYRTDEALASLSVPIHIIRGQRDRIAPEGWCAALGRASRGQVTSVPGAAHMIPLTQPRIVAAAADGFRRTLRSQRRP